MSSRMSRAVGQVTDQEEPDMTSSYMGGKSRRMSVKTIRKTSLI